MQLIPRLAITSFATASLLWLAPAAHADDTPITLGISPAISEITLGRGQTIQRQITVDNHEATPVAARVYAENFEAAGPYGAVSFNTDDTRQYSASSWLKLGSSNLVLNPHERHVLSFQIDSPPDAEPGGHYAAIFFEPVAAQAGHDSSNIGISQRVGALLFITVGGNNTEQGSVLGAQTSTHCSGLKCSFKTDALREWGPVPFAFNFENTGNVHVKVKGNIVITGIFGRKIGEVPVGEKTVLPGSSRSFEATWLREVLFGKYNATLTLTYGTQSRSETASTTFWVVPWRALLVAGLTIGVIWLVVWLVKRKKPRKNQ